MIISRTLFLAALLAFVLAPAACLAGQLDHFCTSCDDVCDSHEDDCLTDPCNVLSLAVTKTRDTDVPLDLTCSHAELPIYPTQQAASNFVTGGTPLPFKPCPACGSGLPLLC